MKTGRFNNGPVLTRPAMVEPTGTVTAVSADGSMVREIAHSLNTPLAQIEAGLLIMQTDPGVQRGKVEGTRTILWDGWRRPITSVQTKPIGQGRSIKVV